MRDLRVGFGRLAAAVSVVVGVLCSAAQAQPKTPATLFFDYAGNRISNNEFVDIRMANPNYPDATRIATLDDGTVEFRLQKVPQEEAPAPEFTVRTLSGGVVSSADLKGKVVVLNFWFVGCPACIDLEPKLNAFKALFAGETDVVFLAMTADPAARVRRYLERHPFDYEQAIEAGDAMKPFIIGPYPKNIVIGRDGKIVYWRSTIRAWDKFEAVVRSEAAKGAPERERPSL